MAHAAFSLWNGRIAPVFDVASVVRIVMTDADAIVAETEARLTDTAPALKALRLAKLGVDTLVCGAISQEMQAALESHGIRVVSFVAGDIHELVEAWRSGTLSSGSFAMPGCAKRRRRRGRQCAGKGSAAARGRRGAMWGGVHTYCGKEPPRAGGECPQCGSREPPGYGIPPAEGCCPLCGSRLSKC